MRRFLSLLALGLAMFALELTPASAAPPAPVFVTGQAAGWPEVRGWLALGTQSQMWTSTNAWPFQFTAYPTYASGVRVAVADVTGDTVPEIVTAPGGDAWASLDVFDARTHARLRSLPPWAPRGSWWGGMSVAAGDVTGDGKAEVVGGLDRGCCTSVNVWDVDHATYVGGFMPFGNQSQVGARVAAADVSGDGRAEIFAVAHGAASIAVFAATGGNPIRTYTPFAGETVYDAAIAAGDVQGDARAEVAVFARRPGGSELKLLDGQSGALELRITPFGAVDLTSPGVAIADVDGDGKRDVVVSAATPAGTQVKAYTATGTEVASFFAIDAGVLPGASLAAGDLDGDGRAEIVLGTGSTGAPAPPFSGPDQRVVVFDRVGRAVGSFSAYPGRFQGGVRVALGDVSGDDRPEVVTGPGPGTSPQLDVFTDAWAADRDRGNRIESFLAFETGFRGGVSVAVGDLAGDAKLEIVAGSGPGRVEQVRTFDGAGRLLRSFTPFESGATDGVNVAAGDLDGDGRAEIVVASRTAPRVRVFDADGNARLLIRADGATGLEVAVGDLYGDGRGEIVAAPMTGGTTTVQVLDVNGATVARFAAYDESFSGGILIGAGDLNGDGRDEILVSPGNGGDTQVRAFDRSFRVIGTFFPYQWRWPGLYVAGRERAGVPIAAYPVTARLRAVRRTTVVVARFLDASGSTRGARATVSWGDGTRSVGAVRQLRGGWYEVRAAKRYVTRGRYRVVVVLTDETGRRSTASSTAVVAARR